MYYVVYKAKYSTWNPSSEGSDQKYCELYSMYKVGSLGFDYEKVSCYHLVTSAPSPFSFWPTLSLVYPVLY